MPVRPVSCRKSPGALEKETVLHVVHSLEWFASRANACFLDGKRRPRDFVRS
jgi:hypothetical protein